MTISFLTDGVWEDGRRIGGGCQDAACLPASGWPAGYNWVCSRPKRGTSTEC